VSHQIAKAVVVIIVEIKNESPISLTRILGVLLDAVAKGLAELPRIKLDKLPRMADFALWATACETAL
jgi:hypothetical protein